MVDTCVRTHAYCLTNAPFLSSPPSVFVLIFTSNQPNNQKRCHFYQLQQLSNNEQAQKLGYVGLMYLVGQPVSVMREKSEIWEASRLRVAMPIRLASGHLCYDKMLVRQIFAVALLVHGRTASRLFDEYGTYSKSHTNPQTHTTTTTRVNH